MYFAPSAADFVTPILKKHFSLPESSDELPRGSDSGGDVHIAAIGPTTSLFLRDTLKLRVVVTSPKPSPDALAAALTQFDERP